MAPGKHLPRFWRAFLSLKLVHPAELDISHFDGTAEFQQCHLYLLATRQFVSKAIRWSSRA